jgi:hypothetical protein
MISIIEAGRSATLKKEAFTAHDTYASVYDVKPAVYRLETRDAFVYSYLFAL